MMTGHSDSISEALVSEKVNLKSPFSSSALHMRTPATHLTPNRSLSVHPREQIAGSSATRTLNFGEGKCLGRNRNYQTSGLTMNSDGAAVNVQDFLKMYS